MYIYYVTECVYRVIHVDILCDECGYRVIHVDILCDECVYRVIHVDILCYCVCTPCNTCRYTMLTL